MSKTQIKTLSTKHRHVHPTQKKSKSLQTVNSPFTLSTLYMQKDNSFHQKYQKNKEK